MNSVKQFELYYGGTFDPVHWGHLTPVLALAESVKAKSLHFMPCYIPPHKEPARVTSQHRSSMLELALSEIKPTASMTLAIETYELNKGGASYTVDTLEHFKRLKPDSKLGLVIGMDSLLSFTTWFNWQQILDLCHLFVMQRPGYRFNSNELDARLKCRLDDNIHLVETPEVDVSSTHVRQLLLLGKTPTEDEVPRVVLEYIERCKLYRSPRL